MDSYAKRRNIIILIFVLIGLVFAIKLFRLQVLDTSYKRNATNNVLREVVEYPSRGLIFDRNGELLVFNQAAYDLMATPREIKSFDTTELCGILDISKESLIRELKKAKIYSRYKPSIIVKQISPERYALLQEKMYKYNGFYFQTRTLRSYNYNIAAHVLGYVGEVNSRNIEEDPFYKPGDYIGVTGLEKSYEKELRGKKGAKFFLVDVYNRVKGAYDQGKLDTSAVKGSDIVSTIDAQLQLYAEELMQNKAGSVVAIEPSTGEILAFLSSPAYSPEDLVGRERIKNFPLLVSDTLKPLTNRAIRGQYPPGSTFKMVNALIGLQEGVITPRTEFMCNHGYHVGSFSQGCHHDQEFSLTGSIASSCNAYYAYTFRRILEARHHEGGVKTGYEKWREYVVSFGFSDRVTAEFGEELKGFVPNSDYYQRRVFPYSRWRALPLISLAIGQGEILTTPMQMANYAAILANRGYYYQPHIVKEISNAEIDPAFREKKYTAIDTLNFEKIVDGMEYVLDYERGGTAYNSYIPGIRMCGKTGTAENPHGADHSTFIAFAPRENPQIAIAVYVENGKWGNLYASPIASLIVEKYLNKEIQPRRKALEEQMLKANLLYPDQDNYFHYE